MNPQIIPLRVGGTVFAVVAAAHLARLVTDMSIVVGSFTVPLWISIAGAIVAGGLSVWMWRASLAGAR